MLFVILSTNDAMETIKRNMCRCVIMTTALAIPLEKLWARFKITPHLVMLTVLRLLSRHSQSNVQKSNSVKHNPWVEFD